mgnify:FL=1
MRYTYKVRELGKDIVDEKTNEVGKDVGASEEMQAGDTCYIREGIYHETITLYETHGKYTSPITFTVCTS